MNETIESTGSLDVKVVAAGIPSIYRGNEIEVYAVIRGDFRAYWKERPKVQAWGNDTTLAMIACGEEIKASTKR